MEHDRNYPEVVFLLRRDFNKLNDDMEMLKEDIRLLSLVRGRIMRQIYGHIGNERDTAEFMRLSRQRVGQLMKRAEPNDQNSGQDDSGSDLAKMDHEDAGSGTMPDL